MLPVPIHSAQYDGETTLTIAERAQNCYFCALQRKQLRIAVYFSAFQLSWVGNHATRGSVESADELFLGLYSYKGDISR